MKQERLLKSSVIALELAVNQLHESIDYVAQQNTEESKVYVHLLDYVAETMYETIEKIKICL